MRVSVTVREELKTPPPPMPSGADYNTPLRGTKKIKIFCPDCGGNGYLGNYFGGSAMACGDCLGKGFTYQNPGLGDGILKYTRLPLAGAITLLRAFRLFEIPSICAFVLNMLLAFAVVWLLNA